MTDRLLIAALCIWFGLGGLIPQSPKPPLTPSQLQVKAKQASKSEVCKGKKKSKKVQDLCKRWKKQQGVL